MDFIPYVFTKKDMIEFFENDKQYYNWVSKEIKKKNIKKVKNGLHIIVDINGYPLANKYEIATAIVDNGFISYHSALEFYGLANQVHNCITVGSNIVFRNFAFDGIEYVCHHEDKYEGVIYLDFAKVRVSSLEKTIIDCIYNINLAGGIEEIIYALDMITTLDENLMLKVLKEYNSVFLYQKVGYILEHYKEQLKFTDSFFDECKSHLTNQVKYFLNDYYKNIKYNATWKLMAPTKLT